MQTAEAWLRTKLHRRTFTRLGALAGAGVVLAPGCKGATPALSARLTGDERVVFEKFAEVYIPTDGTDLKPLSEVPYLDHVDRVLGSLDGPTLEEVHAGLKLFDYGSIVLGLHFKRFIRLTAPQRLAYIQEWEVGTEAQRAVVGLIKKLIAVGYWQDIDAARRVGYQGPVSDEAKILSLGNVPMPAGDVAVP